MKKSSFKQEPYLHYSNCYEDTNSLLSFTKGEFFLTICSGLDNTLSLLTKEPKKVYAFDYNIVQINFSKLKLAAYRYLSYSDLLIFLGVKKIKNEKKYRLSLYNSFENKLENAIINYARNDLEDICKYGLNYLGKFEYYLQLFGKKIMPLTNSKKNISKFMSAETLDEQKKIYKSKINNLRFKLLFKVFFSKMIMKKLGRDKDFFKYVDTSISKYLKAKIDFGFANVLNKDNPYFQFILLQKFNKLPFYLEEKNYNIIKNNLHKVEFIYCNLEDIKNTNLKFDFINLSDIFEYMSIQETQEAEKIILNITNESSHIVFWNMIVDRRFKSNLLKEVDSTDLFIKEKPFFYKKLWRYEKNDNK